MLFYSRCAVQSLKLLYSAVLPEPLLRRVTDGPSMFLALERVGRVDESSMKHVLHALRLVKRYDLLRCLTLRKRKPGKLVQRVTAVMRFKTACTCLS